MICGNIHSEKFEQQLAVLPAALGHAIRFLKDTNLAAHQPGRTEMNLHGVPVILQVLNLTTAPRETLRPEIHRKYIDVQFLAAGGPEYAGFYTDLGSDTVDEDLLDTDRDILFYKNNDGAPEGRLLMIPGTYVVYFPWDEHIPAIMAESGPAPIRKIVIKVPLDACL